MPTNVCRPFLVNFRSILVSFLLCCIAVISAAEAISAQKLSSIDRGRAKDMLNAVKREIKSKYFDTNYKGIDLDARFKAAEEKLDSAQSLGQAFGIVAQAVLELNDSHTRFIPPPTTTSSEYGFRMQMIGEKCLVIAVKPKSDAEKQGLKVGDEIVSIEGFSPNRKEMWKIQYYYNVLSPRSGLSLKVLSPGDTGPRDLNVAAKVHKSAARLSLEDLIRLIDLDTGAKIEHRFAKRGPTVIWKMPSFAIPPESIDEIMKNRVAGSTNLILDLRRNGGGYVVTFERLAGYFVDKDTKIADLKGRKKMDPPIAKTRGKDAFTGKLVVLIDSNSGSASEVFARFIQLQQRGIVVGEQSAGAVMQSQGIPMQMGVESIVPYAMSITNADVIMSDGVSLEHIGVTPQLEIIPAPTDIAAEHDKPLAAALQLLGHEISPEAAGKMFPFEWEDND